jgi:hypothetical protein
VTLVTARPISSVLLAAALAAATAAAGPIAATAQTARDESVTQQENEPLPAYRPPPRGAPGGRVGGASRGTFKVSAPLPTIELLAPGDHTGLTANPAPSLYFFVSGPVAWPTRLTISAPGRPAPALETVIPAPVAAGIYRLDLAGYRVRLDPGIVYTWSVSAILDPNNHAHDIVASASLMLISRAAAAACTFGAAAPPARRAALCAQDGLWYDAVAAAVAAENFDRHRGLDALLREEGLAQAAAYDRQLAARSLR